MRTKIFLYLLLSFHSAIGLANTYQLETVAEGLRFPWCITFLPDGDYLVSMRSGELRRVTAEGEVGAPIANTPESYVASQGGYFDVVLDPDFQNNQTIYLAFAYGAPDSNATRVVKAKLMGNQLEEVTPIFTATYKNTPVHYGGKLAFLNDGTLLITTGDGFDYREAAQDRFSLLGKVARIHTDGTIPADNPYADSKEGDPQVYAYGIRNPQGLAYDAASNTIYMHEHGPQGGDEVNVITAGSNYGWPVTSYGINYSGAKVTPFTSLPDIVEPIKYWTPSIAPSGMAFYTGDAFPDWQGDLLIGALVDQEVRRLDLENGKVVAEETLFNEIGERIRDVRAGPDGMIYLLTDSDKGKVIRIIPK